jgi:hypothetical protein
MVTEIQAMYYNIIFRHFRAVEKQKNIAYSDCVFVALGIQQAMRMRYTIICSLPGCTIFFYIVLLTANFRKKLY